MAFDSGSVGKVDQLRAFWARFAGALRPTSVLVVVMLVSALVYLSTSQTIINGSLDHYTTDVGEIQNALPRWGTIHFNGYPLYTFLGSVFVSLLRVIGIQPAAGSSMFSVLWGVVSVGLLAALAMEMRVPAVLAGITAIFFGLSTSMWMDASIAEVHTLTVALMLATILFAVRFGRGGQRRDVLWLAFLSGQMVAHQPAAALLLPALAVLALPRWRSVWQNLAAVCLLGLLGPLTYLYLPLRVMQGADWVFGTPDTLDGFRVLVLDSKSYITVLPSTVGGWLLQVLRVLDLLNRDLPLPLLAVGLVGLLALAGTGAWRETLAFSLAWIPYAAICMIIWEDRVSDALLAAKLPVAAMSALGLAILAANLGRRLPRLKPVVVVALLAIAVPVYQDHKATVLAVTRDPSAEATIMLAEGISVSAGQGPTTLLVLWGVDNWALEYAQGYQHRLPGLNVVSDNVDLDAITRNGTLLTLSRTFYMRPLAWWEEQLGPVSLQAYAPGIVAIARKSPAPRTSSASAGSFDLGQGVLVRQVDLSWRTEDTLLLVVSWQAQKDHLPDYSVAVHLVSRDPPAGSADLLAQDDRANPVYGWYPVSRWSAGEVVREMYLLKVPAGSSPKAVRLGMYQVSSAGEFRNSPWLSLPVPKR